jgi:translation initiation factor IF-3
MVRCINADGSMVGVVPTREAQRLAEQQGLDLVEISPNADPPVCRVMDYGKFRYLEEQKKKQARKQSVQHSRDIKEMKFHANVEEHDYQTKVSHIRDFLQKGHKVKISLQFRGRENAHRELGFEVVNRVIKDCDSVAMVEMEPRMIGRNLFAMLTGRPQKAQSHQPSPQPQPAPRPSDQPVPEVPPVAPVTPPSEGALKSLDEIPALS